MAGECFLSRLAAGHGLHMGEIGPLDPDLIAIDKFRVSGTGLVMHKPGHTVLTVKHLPVMQDKAQRIETSLRSHERLKDEIE